MAEATGILLDVDDFNQTSRRSNESNKTEPTVEMPPPKFTVFNEQSSELDEVRSQLTLFIFTFEMEMKEEFQSAEIPFTGPSNCSAEMTSLFPLFVDEEDGSILSEECEMSEMLTKKISR